MTTEPITNTDLKAGDEVAVIDEEKKDSAIPGLSILVGAFGFEHDYVPIEMRLVELIGWSNTFTEMQKLGI